VNFPPIRLSTAKLWHSTRTAGRRSTFLQGFGEAAESVLYTFDLLMLRGKDVRSWAIEERRGRHLEIAQQLPPSIRYSETFDAPLPELIKAVRQHQLEGGSLPSAWAVHTAPGSGAGTG
jgi:ATP-dependent DNA ligase